MTDYTNVILESDRLKLVPICMEYAHALCINFTAEITRYMWPSAPKTQEEINQHVLLKQSQMRNGEEISMIITDKKLGEFLGYASVHQVNSKTPELGIWLKAGAQGHHYGYEAIQLLYDWAKQNLKFEHLKYPVSKDNLPSRKLAEKLGGYIGDEYIKISESGNELDEVEYWIE